MQSKSQHERKSTLTLAKHKQGERKGRVSPCRAILSTGTMCGSVWVCVSGRGRNIRATCQGCHIERPDAVGKAASQPACEGSEIKIAASVHKAAEARKQFSRTLKGHVGGKHVA